MPKKEWFIPMEGFYLRIQRRTESGEIVSFAVVLFADIQDEWVNISRYDTAHGYPHRDVLGKREGLRGKLRMTKLTKKQVFRYAIRDLTENAENYLEDFLAH
jgi:hypothetical protein